MEQGVNAVGRSRLGPVARFSITLAAILVVTAVALAAMTNALLDRYVQDETARFTEVTVASHFGVIFQDDVFQRPLHDDEREGLEAVVAFHLSISNIVATQFFDPTGKIVFSYDEGEIGRRIDPATEDGLAAALAGRSYAERTRIVSDLRYASPGAVAASYSPAPSAPAGHDHSGPAASGQPGDRAQRARSVGPRLSEGRAHRRGRRLA